MISDAIYFLIPLFAAFPVYVAFINFRESKEKDKHILFQNVIALSFLILQLSYVILHISGFPEYIFIIKILDPVFLVFLLIKEERRYRETLSKMRWVFCWISVNCILRLLLNTSDEFYSKELILLFADFIFAYTIYVIDREYCKTIYIPDFLSRIALYLYIPCAIFDSPFFRILYVMQIFYMCFEQRRKQLAFYRNLVDERKVEQERFQNMFKELSDSIKDFANQKEALITYLKTLCKFLNVKGAAIYEWDGDKNYYSCVSVYGLYFPLIRSGKSFFIPEAMREIALKQKISDAKSLIWQSGNSNKGIYLRYARQNEQIMKMGAFTIQNINTLIIEPLIQENELLGVLVLENKLDNNYFGEFEYGLVKSFSHFASIILNSSKIIAQRKENDRMLLELNTGNIVQKALFTKLPPQIPGMRVSVFMQPAKEIGGDCYEFIRKNDKLGIAIGDVSGKGVAAGILVAILQTYLQNQYPKSTNLKGLIVELNSYLCHKINMGMFITMLFFEWDAEAKKLRYVSCGHEHILHFHAKTNKLDSIRSGGLAIMMDDDLEPYIQEKELSVEEGDSIILYTDGIVECMNANKELFGLERLQAFLENEKNISPETVLISLPRVLAKWRGETLQSDDITCLLMQF